MHPKNLVPRAKVARAISLGEKRSAATSSSTPGRPSRCSSTSSLRRPRTGLRNSRAASISGTPARGA
eukprot:11163607-Lingulodinium_polyedra.AAC.1